MLVGFKLSSTDSMSLSPHSAVDGFCRSSTISGKIVCHGSTPASTLLCIQYNSATRAVPASYSAWVQSGRICIHLEVHGAQGAGPGQQERGGDVDQESLQAAALGQVGVPQPRRQAEGHLPNEQAVDPAAAGGGNIVGSFHMSRQLIRLRCEGGRIVSRHSQWPRHGSHRSTSVRTLFHLWTMPWSDTLKVTPICS